MQPMPGVPIEGPFHELLGHQVGIANCLRGLQIQEHRLDQSWVAQTGKISSELLKQPNSYLHALEASGQA